MKRVDWHSFFTNADTKSIGSSVFLIEYVSPVGSDLKVEPIILDGRLPTTEKVNPSVVLREADSDSLR